MPNRFHQAGLLVAALLLTNTGLSDSPAVVTGPPDCQLIADAYARLQSSCYTVTRRFEARLNDEPVLREHALVSYNAGKVSVEVVKKEVLNKKIKIGGEGDMATDIEFGCDRIRRTPDGAIELSGSEDPETVEFDYSVTDNMLSPRRWHFEERGRFLFKKYHIEAQAEYSDLEFSQCSAESD